ncbi:MAG: hypothetical protein RML40_11610 [Bacteroidota bacterium]|nr:hypothetical protein [Candidatus Kapabacteria bacterium]MDW8221163.1 hypothetical protein [Bacteroidota bacterium]
MGFRASSVVYNIAIILLFFLHSCATVRLHHIGRMYPPSLSVDVLYAEKDVKATRYEFMGEILLETTEPVITPFMEQQLIYEARLRGANAVILGELDARFASPPGPEVTIRVIRARLLRYL